MGDVVQPNLRLRLRFDQGPTFVMNGPESQTDWSITFTQVTLAAGAKLWVKVEDTTPFYNRVAGEGIIQFDKGSSLEVKFPENRGSFGCRVIPVELQGRLFADSIRELDSLLPKGSTKPLTKPGSPDAKAGELRWDEIDAQIESLAALSSWEHPSVKDALARRAAKKQANL